MPRNSTAHSGWLYAWSWGIEQASQKKDKAWQFISWASGKDYEQLVGEKVGWSSVPAGKRDRVAALGEERREDRAPRAASDDDDPERGHERRTKSMITGTPWRSARSRVITEA